MPMYEYRCTACKVRFDAFKKLADYAAPQLHACGELAEKLISKPMIAVDYPAYVSPATGKVVEGKKAHLEDLRQSGCRLLEPGEREDSKRRAVEQEKKMESFIDNSVDKVFAEITG